MGHEAASFGSPAAALSALEEGQDSDNSIKLILLDSMMPGMTGFEFTEHVRRGALRQPVIIMLSAAGDLGATDRLRELKIARCLTKPVMQSDLLNTILNQLDPHPDDSASASELTKDRQSSSDEVRADDLTIAVADRLRVLLVEDGMVNRKVAEGFLAIRGHQYVTVGNGKEALAILDEQSFDVVLMDIHMPVMDGLTATRAIRASEQSTVAHIPIVAMTANAMKGDRDNCLAAGMDDYLAKPIRQNYLYQVIENVSQRIADQADSRSQARTDESENSEEPSLFIDWQAFQMRIPGG